MLKEYFSIAEILELRLDGYLARYNLEVKANQENWLFRVANSATKPYKEYHISNFPIQIREKIVGRLLERARLSNENNGKNIEFVQASIRIAYSRLEIVLFIRNNKININKFCAIYNDRGFLREETPLFGSAISAVTYENVTSITERTLYRWIKAYDTQGLEGLKYKADERRLGRNNMENSGVITLPKGEETNIKELAIGLFLDKPYLKVKVIYKFLKELTKKHDIKVPAYRTICNWLKDYKSNNKAEVLLASNPDKYKSKYLLAIGSYSEEAIEPNYIWEVDSTPADIMLKEGRCTILGCIDVHTRRAKFLVQKSSNALGITSLIRNCILDWGLPKIIKSDHGSDYKSKHVEIALKVLNIEQRFTNAFSGWEKPFIERVFRTTQHSHLELHKDFIGHNVAERKAIESVNSFAERLLKKEKDFPTYSIEDLQYFLDFWVNSYYLNRPHEGLKKYIQQNKLEILPTPNAMLQFNIEQGFKVLEPTSRRELDLLLEPLAGKRTIGKKGIWVDNIPYFEPNPMAMMVGQQVIVRIDRFDMGKVYVFDKKHTLICEAINYSLLGADKQEFIQKGKQIQNKVIKEVKAKTKRLINKAKQLDYIAPIQIDIEEAIKEIENKELLEEKNYVRAIENKSIELTENQRRIQKEIAEELKFEIPEDKDEEFRLFLLYKQKELQEESLNTVPKIVKDFAVYIDGIRYAGQVSEIELPKIAIKKEDYRVGYMNVTITMGLEPLECTITMVEQVKSVFLLMGVLNNATGNLVSFRGYQEGEGGLLNNNAIEIQMRGVFTEYDMGSSKRGDMPSYKIKIALQQYIYKQDGVPLITIDPYTNTFMVGAVDQLLATKKALGII